MSARGVLLRVDVAGRRVLCVGGGEVAAAKLTGFLDAGAAVDVVAPEAVPAIVEAAAAGRLRWQQRRYRPSDLDGALLVLAATADPDLNAAVAADADAVGTLCIRVDAGGDGSAALLAAVQRGPLALAVSPGGAAPALARRLRRELAERYGHEYGDLAALLGDLRADATLRARLAALDAAERRRRWHAVLDADLLPLVRAGRVDEASRRARAILERGAPH